METYAYSDNKLYGVAEGVSYGQHERVDELNERISTRHFPDMHLAPNFNLRPVPTKYSRFPIVERRKPVLEERIDFVQHDVNANFNPGTARAPPSGFLNNIDVETVLRNQVFALQGGHSASTYISSSKSDLYNVSVISGKSEQPFPLLFSQQTFNNNVHPNNASGNIGNETFFNHTRTQMRNV